MLEFWDEDAQRSMLERFLEAGESLLGVERALDRSGSRYLVGRTGRRFLVGRLNRFFEVKKARSVPLGEAGDGRSIVDRLKRFAPGEPVTGGERERLLYEMERETVDEHLEAGEELVTLGMGRERSLMLTHNLYVAVSDRRLILLKLEKTRETVGVESFPLDELEGIAHLLGRRPVPLDTPLFSSQETHLLLRYRDGRERKILLTDMFGHRREDAVD